MCVMLIIPLCKGAKLVAALSSLLEAMSGVLVFGGFFVCLFLFIAFMFFRPYSIPSYRRGSKQIVSTYSWDSTRVLVQNIGS